MTNSPTECNRRHLKRVLSVVIANDEMSGQTTAPEEIVRQAVAQGVEQSIATEALECLQAKGIVYQIHPGLLRPVTEDAAEETDENCPECGEVTNKLVGECEHCGHDRWGARQ